VESSVEKQLIKALINAVTRIERLDFDGEIFSGISEMDVIEFLRILKNSGIASERIVYVLDIPIKELISSHTNLMNTYGYSIEGGDPCYLGRILAYEYGGQWCTDYINE